MFGAATSVDYFIEARSDTGKVTTYVYGTDNNSNISPEMGTAESSPFRFDYRQFTSTPTPTLTNTATPTPFIMEVWHSPDYDEGVNRGTLRSPLYPSTSDSNVAIQFGVALNGTASGGTLYFKESTQSTWRQSAFRFYYEIIARGGRDYWITHVELSQFDAGDTIQYFIETNSSMGLPDSYLYGTDSSYVATWDRTAAENAPYTFTLLQGSVTPTPTTSPTPSPSPTSTFVPNVELAGYWSTELRVGQQSTLYMAALSLNNVGGTVETIYFGEPLGITLTDDGQNGDASAGDGLFWYQLPFDLSAVSTPLFLQIDMQPSTASGLLGPSWPYLNVK